MTQMQAQASAITLKGSAAIVAEFFGYSFNSILFQRGIYDASTFAKLTKYGLGLQVTTDPQLAEYLKKVLVQLNNWLELGEVKKVVVVISGIDTNEALERWVFDVETDSNAKQAIKTGESFEVAISKTEKEIQKEIAAILRQITSSVSFLPLIDQPCSFDILIYTPDDSLVPTTWEESDPKYILKSNQVQFRSFDTTLHKVDASVTYREIGL